MGRRAASTLLQFGHGAVIENVDFGLFIETQNLATSERLYHNYAPNSTNWRRTPGVVFELEDYRRIYQDSSLLGYGILFIWGQIVNP